MKPAGTSSVFLAGRRIRLFRRSDRPSRYWQAAFRLPGKARPLVKSTGQVDLAAARRWALDLLPQLGPDLATMTPPLPREDLLAPYPFPRIRQEKRHVEREIALRTLSAYQRHPLLAQRHLAQALDVSLAIVNAYTARCVRAGWLLKLERPSGRGRGYRYVLTDLGRARLRELLAAYVDHELHLFRALKADFAQLLAAAAERKVILVGTGDLAAIARLALAEAGRAPILELPIADLAALERPALRRRHAGAVLWLVELPQGEVLRLLGERPADSLPLMLPALLREFAPAGSGLPAAIRPDVKTKTMV
ncbi:MAG: hypothetical protein JNL25_09170 [Rhodospirillaceae bacterium]|nr:hypothetical protein [Rhodospirillaceae bacterium]